MRYIIGIDLGTTNSCVAYVDTQDPRTSIRALSIPQLVAPGHIESKSLLPSFCYLAGQEEWNKGELGLPWNKKRDYAVGSFALSHGSKIPTRLVTSAKSWLCHTSASRRDPILPPGGAANLRISPVEASARYLRHIAEVWNWTLAKGEPENEFEQQEIILTVPASFDEVARALTIESAKKAGYTTVTMLEEPQAAFYNWIDHYEHKWKGLLNAGDRVLVCDVGGGTADFSFIAVDESEDKLAFRRMAVGEHLLLGGENIDNALAQVAADKLQMDLKPEQWHQLCHQARQAKESIYGQNNDSFRFILTGTGSKVVGGTKSCTINRQEADEIVLKGFFGYLPWEDAIRKTKITGFKTIGLPYEQEPSIIKHLAQFLNNHNCIGNSAPTHILFNGGTMLPSEFQKAVIDSLQKWFPEISIQKLGTPHFDHAVARGAAYYGKVRRGLGVRISGGSPRAYYIGVEVKKENESLLHALTLLPRGTEEGTNYVSEQTFMAVPNKPVSFNLMTSHVRLHDKAGDLIAIDESELHQLPPIHTILRFGKKGSENVQPIPVRLGITLSSIGTLEIWLQSLQSAHRWELEFQLRTATGQDNSIQSVEKARKDETFTSMYLNEAISKISETFTPGSGIAPKTLMEHLEKALEMPRKEWPLSVLRGLWPALLEAAPGRSLSQEHTERWWNLAGFLLRPGYGYPLDDFRLKDLWKLVLGELKRNKDPVVELQQLICFRRVSAGLNRGQQLQVASEIIPHILSHKGIIPGKPPHLYQERMRTIAALELIEISTKVKIGQALIDKICKGEAEKVEYWALGRIAARQLLNGTLSHIIHPASCSAWIEKLLVNMAKLPTKNAEEIFAQMARLTGHREIDISEKLRLNILEKYPNDHLRKSLMEIQPLSHEEQEQSFGEALPPGLVLCHVES